MNRTTRSVVPTEAGRAYYDRLRPLVEELDVLDLDIRNISQNPRGRLWVTAPLTFGIRELSPALNDFAARYPEIELDVSFSDRAVSVVEDGFDLAVRIGRPSDSSLIIRKLCSVRILADHNVRVSIEPGLPPARLDAVLFEQALFNILDNAAKYAGVGGTVVVRLWREEAILRLSVADSGPGIPQEDLEAVFEKFYRIRKGDGVRPGTGLGLAIARGFVESMGGTVKAGNAGAPHPSQPTAVRGAVLLLSLPVAE